MRIAVSAGHNVYVANRFDPGAVCEPWVEADINKETVKLLVQMLERQGHIVLDVTPYNEYFSTRREHHALRCKRADDFGADLYLDVHINAGKGTGVEVWVFSLKSKSVPYAEKIVNSIAEKIELRNRGVKADSSYLAVSLGKAPAMIVEGCFIDNPLDMAKFTTEKYAKAIAECFGDLQYEEKTEEKNLLYKVQLGAFKIRDNADKLIRELSNKGYKGIIIEEIIKEIPNEVSSDNKGSAEDLKKSRYFEHEGLKIIETDYDNIYVAALKGMTLKEYGIYGINGTWQNTNDAKNLQSIWGIAVNNNKAIGPNSGINSPKGYKRGTLVCYKDGSMEVIRINSVSEFRKSVAWAIGGGMLFPDYNPILEGFTSENNASDVLRTTAHTAIGYKKDKVYLMVHNFCSMNTFKQKISSLGLEGAVFLDGGGSTQLNYLNGKGIDSSRKLSHGVFIKEL